ncbi:DUF6300 family protein [Microbispora rosea]|uniref:DUF6300 family protein n=1 Tax=Microbispora rosea TaxID=58117 RepID=UPI0004C45189|nr:DUF6300 family protein [Microbispora rosea]
MSHAPASDKTCPRCRTGEVLAVLRLPHTWTNTSGRPVRGIREVHLCTHCDAGHPIVTYFAIHGSARPEHADFLARLLRHWTDHVRPLVPDENALRAEADAWCNGEL